MTEIEVSISILSWCLKAYYIYWKTVKSNNMFVYNIEQGKPDEMFYKDNTQITDYKM